MFTTLEVVAFLFAGMTGETRVGSFLRRLVLERDNLRRISFGYVGLAWPVAGFTTSDFALPAVYRRKLRVRRMRVGFEHILVAIFAGFAANVIFCAVACRLDCCGGGWK